MIICEILLIFWVRGGGLKSTMGGIGALKDYIYIQQAFW